MLELDLSVTLCSLVLRIVSKEAKATEIFPYKKMVPGPPDMTLLYAAVLFLDWHFTKPYYVNFRPDHSNA